MYFKLGIIRIIWHFRDINIFQYKKFIFKNLDNLNIVFLKLRCLETDKIRQFECCLGYNRHNIHDIFSS